MDDYHFDEEIEIPIEEEELDIDRSFEDEDEREMEFREDIVEPEPIDPLARREEPAVRLEEDLIEIPMGPVLVPKEKQPKKRELKKMKLGELKTLYKRLEIPEPEGRKTKAYYVSAITNVFNERKALIKEYKTLDEDMRKLKTSTVKKLLGMASRLGVNVMPYLQDKRDDIMALIKKRGYKNLSESEKEALLRKYDVLDDDINESRLDLISVNELLEISHKLGVSTERILKDKKDIIVASIDEHISEYKTMLSMFGEDMKKEQGIEFKQKLISIGTKFPIRVSLLVPQKYERLVEDDGSSLEYKYVIKVRKEGKYLIPAGRGMKTKIIGDTSPTSPRRYVPDNEYKPPVHYIKYSKSRPNVYEYYPLPIENDIRKHFVEIFEAFFIDFFSIHKEVITEGADEIHEEGLYRPGLTSWLHYYSSEFRRWAYTNMINDIRRHVDTMEDDINTETDQMIANLTQPQLVIQELIQRHGINIFNGTDRDIVDILSKSKDLTSLDVVILREFKRRAELPPTRGIALAAELSSIIDKYIDQNPPNRDLIKRKIYDSRVNTIFNSYEPTDEDRKAFNDKNLDKLRQMYSDYIKDGVWGE